jgi:hypothetical protein
MFVIVVDTTSSLTDSYCGIQPLIGAPNDVFQVWSLSSSALLSLRFDLILGFYLNIPQDHNWKTTRIWEEYAEPVKILNTWSRLSTSPSLPALSPEQRSCGF